MTLNTLFQRANNSPEGAQGSANSKTPRDLPQYAEAMQICQAIQDDDSDLALILAAAAKMVRQSGAVQALEKWDDESAIITPPDQKDFVDVQMSPEAYEGLYAAFQSLRSITGEAGEWPVSSPSPKTAPLGLESFFSWVVIWFWQSWSQCP